RPWLSARCHTRHEQRWSRFSDSRQSDVSACAFAIRLQTAWYPSCFALHGHWWFVGAPRSSPKFRRNHQGQLSCLLKLVPRLSCLLNLFRGSIGNLLNIQSGVHISVDIVDIAAIFCWQKSLETAVIELAARRGLSPLIQERQKCQS